MSSNDLKDDGSFASLFEESARGGRRAKSIKTGETVEGVVVQVGRENVFVELDGKRSGYLDIGELTNDDGEVRVKVGDTVKAKVVEVDGKTQSVRLALGPPQAAVGSVVTGTVEKVENFGVFVQLDSIQGRTGRGLVPNAELGTPRGSDTRKLFPEGAKVTVRVLESPDGRLRLSIRGATDAAERKDYESFKKTQQKAAEGTAAEGEEAAAPGPKGGRRPEKKPGAKPEPRGFGTLGDLLRAHSEKKKG
jgi:small subunit ribosomal protein S1